MRRDYLGNILNVGDKVIFIRPHYREYTQGKIIRFTNCYIIVSTQRDDDGNYVEDSSNHPGGTIKQTPNQLIKIIRERG